MHQIDKFFSHELDVCLNSTDDEYHKYLSTQKKDDDDFQRQIEDLDEYFLNDPASPAGDLERQVTDQSK
jgi:hypothetical protein